MTGPRRVQSVDDVAAAINPEAVKTLADALMLGTDDDVDNAMTGLTTDPVYVNTLAPATAECGCTITSGAVSTPCDELIKHRNTVAKISVAASDFPHYQPMLVEARSAYEKHVITAARCTS